MIAEKHRLIVDTLIDQNIIPSEGIFEIDQKMIDFYFSTYHAMYGKSNVKIRNSNIRYAKRLAGITLLKINNERRETLQISFMKKSPIKPKNGLFYIVSHPLFEDSLKVGMTTDMDKRLAVYQTGDPFRRYKVEHYIFCADCRKTEKEVLEKFAVDISMGEWLKGKRALEILRFAEK